MKVEVEKCEGEERGFRQLLINVGRYALVYITQFTSSSEIQRNS